MCSPRQGHALATRRQARSWADKEVALGHRDAKTHAPRDTLSQPGTSAGQEMLWAVPYQLPVVTKGTWKPGGGARLCPAVQAGGQAPPPPSELGALSGDELTKSH